VHEFRALRDMLAESRAPASAIRSATLGVPKTSLAFPAPFPYGLDVIALGLSALYSCFSEIVKSTTVGSLGFTVTFFVQLTGVL